MCTGSVAKKQTLYTMRDFSQLRGFLGCEDTGVDEGGEGPREGVDRSFEADDALGGIGADVGVSLELSLGGFPDVEAGGRVPQLHVVTEPVEPLLRKPVDLEQLVQGRETPAETLSVGQNLRRIIWPDAPQ